MMTLAKFVALVIDMRRAQRRYFNTPRGNRDEWRLVLEESKRLERLVDRACADFTAPGLEL